MSGFQVPFILLLAVSEILPLSTWYKIAHHYILILASERGEKAEWRAL